MVVVGLVCYLVFLLLLGDWVGVVLWGVWVVVFGYCSCSLLVGLFPIGYSGVVDKIVARRVLLGGGTVVPPVPSNPSRVGVRVIGGIRIEGGGHSRSSLLSVFSFGVG